MVGTEREARRPQRVPARPESVGDTRVAVLPAPVRRAPVLQVGAVHDPAEHAADRLAERVVARLRAQESAGSDADAEHAHDEHAHDEHAAGHPHAAAPVRRAAAPTVGREGGPAGAELSTQIEAMRGGGSALDADVRRRMGGAFGTDFSGVRVHTDEHAAQAASAMGALAFTTGNDIFFGAGQYRPDDAGGEHVLAHELAHTVQQRGGARRKVSRLWNLKTFEGADLGRATSIKVLKDREVMFLKDSSDDTMVVKVEDEMIGLGALAGVMHKKLTGSETVQYLKYPAGAKTTLKHLLDQPDLLDRDSWSARGGFADTPKNYPGIDDPVARGVEQFKDHLDSRKGASLMAMTFTRAERAVERNGREDGDDKSLKALLEQSDHAKALGKMTAVDLLLGNKDRVLSGNLGNWFYNPSGAMVVIDNVDALALNHMIRDMKAGTVETEYLTRLGDDKLKATAKEAITGLLGGMDAVRWGNELVDGKKRRAKFEADMLAGLTEGKKHIVKVFSSTRLKGAWANHKAKKSIKKYARTTFAVDDGEGSSPYYETLKARAAWLKTH